jgi:hypothetical protein
MDWIIFDGCGHVETRLLEAEAQSASAREKIHSYGFLSVFPHALRFGRGHLFALRKARIDSRANP